MSAGGEQRGNHAILGRQRSTDAPVTPDRPRQDGERRVLRNVPAGVRVSETVRRGQIGERREQRSVHSMGLGLDGDVHPDAGGDRS